MTTKIFFFKNYAENDAGRLAKSKVKGKSKWSAAYFQYVSLAINLGYNKNKLHKTLDYWSRDMLNFNFPEKGLGLVSAPHFEYGFFKKNVSHVIFY